MFHLPRAIGVAVVFAATLPVNNAAGRACADRDASVPPGCRCGRS